MDFKKNIFGAYISQYLAPSLKPYGDGDTYLYTFVNEKRQIEVFDYCGKDENLIYSDSDGIAVGIDYKFGLFIHKELLRGESNPTDIFNNKVLSPEKDF